VPPGNADRSCSSPVQRGLDAVFQLLL